MARDKGLGAAKAISEKLTENQEVSDTWTKRDSIGKMVPTKGPSSISVKALATEQAEARTNEEKYSIKSQIRQTIQSARTDQLKPKPTLF